MYIGGGRTPKENSRVFYIKHEMVRTEPGISRSMRFMNMT